MFGGRGNIGGSYRIPDCRREPVFAIVHANTTIDAKIHIYVDLDVQLDYLLPVPGSWTLAIALSTIVMLGTWAYMGIVD